MYLTGRMQTGRFVGMATSTLNHTDLFAALDSAMIAVEFAHITGEVGLAEASEQEVREVVAEAISRGYILDALNCQTDDQVQNLHGDTGHITAIHASPHAPRIDVHWDAPTEQPVSFTAATLAAGHLRHRR